MRHCTEGVFAAKGAGTRLNSLLGWALGAVMPWFLTQIAADYGDWATGQPRGRSQANLSAVATEIISGSRGKLPDGVEEVPVSS